VTRIAAQRGTEHTSPGNAGMRSRRTTEPVSEAKSISSYEGEPEFIHRYDPRSGPLEAIKRTEPLIRLVTSVVR